MVAEFPALPLFTDAYLADTRHLTTVEHGAYLLLLMEAWRRPNTSLPDNDDLLSKLAGIPAPEWHMHKDTIMAFWEIDERTKTWSQKRLTDEKFYVKKNSKKQRSNAKARWDKEKSASHGKTNGHATILPEASQNDAPTPTPTPTEEKNNQGVIPKNTKKASSKKIPLPDDWMPRQVDIDRMVEQGLGPSVLEEEIDNIKDWALSQGATKKDWDATFRMWMRRVKKDGRFNGT